MPHIHTAPGEHDQTVSAYIVRTDFDQPKIMMHLHKKLGMYMQFGGHIEVTENPWQAICHELLEESGYEMSQLQILQPKQRIKQLTRAQIHPQMIYQNTHAFNDSTHFHTDIGYAFVTDQPPSHVVAANESDKVLFLTRDELADFPSDKMYESVREPALFVLDTGLQHWERVDTADFS